MKIENLGLLCGCADISVPHIGVKPSDKCKVHNNIHFFYKKRKIKNSQNI